MSSSIFQLAIAGAAVVLLVTPKGAKASHSALPINSKEAAVLGLIATVTLPIWIVPAAVFGVVVGVKQKLKDATPVAFGTTLAADATKTKAARTEEIRPHFEAAEKDPTPHALFRLGIHLLLAADLQGARRFLRRAIALAKTQNPSGWDRTDIQLLPLLALANQQMGDIQMRLHVFNEAHEHYVECKRLLDNLAKLGEEQKPKKNANKSDNDNDDASEDETVNLLDRDTVDHNIGWSLLHKALYSTTPNSKEEHDANASAVGNAAALLKQTRAVSIWGELRCAIGEFFSFVYPFSHNRPPPTKKGDSRKNESDTYDFSDPFYTEFMPKFRDEFWEKIAPVFFDLCKKHETSTPGSGEHSIWLEANTYLGRCYFIKGGDQNEKWGREVVDRVSEYVWAHPECDQSLTNKYSNAGLFCGTGYDDQSRRNEAEFYRISYSCEPRRLAPPQGVLSGTAPHEWVRHTCWRPTFCDKCMKFITWSENHEGCFMCKACHFRCHAECKAELGNDAVCAVASDVTQMEDHQHVMRKTVLGRPTWCAKCNEYIKNPFGAFACEVCSTTVHEDCMKNMTNVLAASK